MDTKERTMPTTINIKGSELPADLAERVGVSPNETVWLTISLENPSPKEQMRQILARSHAYARKQGLTEEKLDELLKDE